MINLFQPQVGEDELAAVGDVFASAWLGAGARLTEFERAFAEHLHRPAEEVLSVASCTEGLFQVFAALGFGPGDEVVLPTVSFLGAAHAVRSTGARVVLCDVDPVTLNPTVEHIERVLTSRTKAVAVLHYGGRPGEVADIAELTRRRSILLVEDAACGLGATATGHPCGTLGDVGVWSFDAMKTVTAGDGGMIWSRDPELAERLRAAIRLGVGSSGFSRRASGTRWWEIDPDTLGRRGTMNDIAAAIGLVQLRRLPEFLLRRAEVAARYEEAFATLPWISFPHPPDPAAARTFWWLQTDPQHRDRLAAHLLAHGIYATFRYWPLHAMRMYRDDRDYPGADRAAATTLLLPLHPALSDADVDRIVNEVRAFDPAIVSR